MEFEESFVTDWVLCHPVPLDLERYSLDELEEPELGGIEEHLLVCEVCRQSVSELDAFRPLLDGSGRRTSCAFVHHTGDGAVRLELRAMPNHRWAAKFSGEELEGSAIYESARDACGFLRRAFREMYPGHLCSAECGAPD
jgi:hypothetical protein